MSDKKNIDRLFQEKFKEFEMSPSDEVWKKIRAKKEADRKRIIVVPLWYQIAGIAALIAVLFSVSTVILSDWNAEQNLIVTTENIEETSIPTRQTIQTDTNSSVDNNQYTNNLEKKSNETNKTGTENNNNKQELANLNTESKSKNTTISNRKALGGLDKNSTKHYDESANKSEIAQNTQSKKNFEDQNFINTPENPVKQIINTQIANTDIQNEKTENQKDSLSRLNNKKSIFDAIKEKEAIATIDAKKEKKSDKKWNIAPNLAPVYYDSFNDGSSINSEFSDNKKQGEVNLSYGIKVAYAINKKLSIRSGISKVDLAYNTQNVGFGTTSITSGASSNNQEIDINNVQNIMVSDFAPRSAGGSFSSAPSINSETLFESKNPGILNHNLGYIEVPIELKYALTSSKLGIHMIGGVSTLFLAEENVTINAGNFSSNNVIRDDTVNDISFSGNIGFGVDYKVSDKFLINLEPILKYQFNGFKDSAENFTPYFFGVYTGISFQF